MVEVRKAGINDWEAIGRLLLELRRATGQAREPEPCTGGGEWRGILYRTLEDPNWLFLLAFDGDAEVGLLVMSVFPSLFHGGDTSLITELVVAESQRGKAAGRRLVEEAIRFARSAGCVEIAVSTETENAGARKFYRRMGFDQEHVHLEMDL